MSPDDFDRNWDRMRRDHRRIAVVSSVVWALIILFWIMVGAAAVYLLLHPETIGWFVGRIVAGARSAS